MGAVRLVSGLLAGVTFVCWGVYALGSSYVHMTAVSGWFSTLVVGTLAVLGFLACLIFAFPILADGSGEGTRFFGWVFVMLGAPPLLTMLSVLGHALGFDRTADLVFAGRFIPSISTFGGGIVWFFWDIFRPVPRRAISTS